MGAIWGTVVAVLLTVSAIWEQLGQFWELSGQLEEMLGQFGVELLDHGKRAVYSTIDSAFSHFVTIHSLCRHTP